MKKHLLELDPLVKYDPKDLKKFIENLKETATTARSLLKIVQTKTAPIELPEELVKKELELLARIFTTCIDAKLISVPEADRVPEFILSENCVVFGEYFFYVEPTVVFVEKQRVNRLKYVGSVSRNSYSYEDGYDSDEIIVSEADSPWIVIEQVVAKMFQEQISCAFESLAIDIDREDDARLFQD